jgi:hypothetical protein
MPLFAYAFRSCDLDEWTVEQLDIMKLSGNGNTRAFLKKHGVTDAQMESDKKYQTKAAQEYKRHLAKLVAESDSSPSPLKEAPVETVKVAAWESSSGLDNLLRHVSGEDLVNLGQADQTEKEAPPSTSIFMAAEAAKLPTPVVTPASIPAPVYVQPKPVEKKEPQIIGTLSVSGEEGDAAAAMLKVSKLGVAKKIGGAKKIGARKLVGSSSGIGMESFEEVNRRSEAQQQEEADHALVVKMAGANVGGGSSGSARLAAVYQEAESIYKPATPAIPINSYSSSARDNGSRGGTSSAPNSVPASAGHATQKFSSSKGISSDQYFDRGFEVPEDVRTRLGGLSGSNAISSDMLLGGQDGRAGRSDSYDFLPDELSLREIKKSVKGFFDSVQNM